VAAVPAQNVTVGGGSDPKPAAKESNDPAPPDQSTIKIRTNLVTAPITVIDKQGQLVYNLDKKDIQLYDNGALQQIDRFDQVAQPIAAVILVQTSDSVATLLDQVKPVAPLFSQLLLGGAGEAAVIFYDSRVRVAQDFANNSDGLDKTFRGLQVGWTNTARLNDAIARGLSMLEGRPQNERRVIIAFADGRDHGSETKTEDVIRRATGDEVTIYGLGFSPAQSLLKRKPDDDVPPAPLDVNMTRPTPPGMTPTPTLSQSVWGTPVNGGPIIKTAGQEARGVIWKNSLEHYAAYTGGAYRSHWSKSTLQDQLSGIASEIQGSYEVAYRPNNLSQPGFHEIEVEVDRPGVKARTRAGYYVGQSAQPVPAAAAKK
jgi:VWFA-related protein